MYGAVTQSSRPKQPEPAEPEVSVTDRVFATFQNEVNMPDLVDFLIDRGQLGFDSEGATETFEKLDPAYLGRMFAEPKRFATAVREWAASRKEVAK